MQAVGRQTSRVLRTTSTVNLVKPGGAEEAGNMVEESAGALVVVVFRLVAVGGEPEQKV